MRIIDRHIEYLIRRHDCVVVPGVGALLCRFKSSAFGEDGKEILPPGRELAFNPWLTESDGLLVSSVARELGVDFEQASEVVKGDVGTLKSVLGKGGEFILGSLGVFRLSDNDEIAFTPFADVPGVNGAFYGLRPISPVLLASKNSEPAVGVPHASADSLDADEGVRRFGLFPSQWRAYASGTVATLAVLLTLAFFVLSPIRIDKNAQTASIAPVAGSYVQPEDGVRSLVGQAARLAADGISPFIKTMGLSSATPDHISYVTEAVVAENIEEPVSVGMTEDNIADPVAVAPAAEEPKTEPQSPSIRFNDADPYFVIVASFPTIGQAKSFINASKGHRLGILEMDGRFRVYAATGQSYASASSMTALVNEPDAWICRR